jgi:hypothetical protein
MAVGYTEVETPVKDGGRHLARSIVHMRAIRIHEFGGPDVLRPEEVPDPVPGPGQALVRIEAAGVNYVDIYQRSGLYPLPLPAILGNGRTASWRRDARRGRCSSSRRPTPQPEGGDQSHERRDRR